MTRDDIIEAARKAGFETKWDMTWVDKWEITRTLTRFAALVAAAERAACIDDCNAEAMDDGTAQRIVERIRARGQS